MIKYIRLFILFGITSGVICGLFSTTAYAQSASKSEGTTFVGRGGKVTITDKHGAQVVEGVKVRPVNRITIVTPPPPPPPAPAEGDATASSETKPEETAPAEGAKPDGETTQDDPNKPATGTKPIDGKELSKDPAAKSTEPKKADSETTAALSPKEAKKKAAEKAAEQAAADARKQKDIEKLRSIQQTGGWFYTKDGKAISNEELTERIKKGKVEDIKATDIYEEQYSTESSKDKTTK